MPTPSSSSAPMIKGYLPVRLLIPSHDGRGVGDDTDETFFFVREHQGRFASTFVDSKNTTNSNESSEMERGSTLFVANAPVVPGVSTECLLKSIFGRFGVVTRVTAVQNPRASALVNEDGITMVDTMITSSFSWFDNEIMFTPSFLPPILSSVEGKYAHVVFSSAKEMKNAKKELEHLMTTNSGKKRSRHHSQGRNKKKGRKNLNKNEEEGEQNEIPPRAIIIDKLEIQTLSDESQRQRNEVLKKNLHKKGNGDHTDDEYGESDENDSVLKNNRYAGILAVSHRYRETSRLLRNRSKLMDECNAVMEAYENAEEAKLKAQEIAKSEPDSNGFVTVSYSNAVGSKVELEQSITATTPSRRNGNKRSRKKKDAIGTLELKDFYRFQRKDNRKRTMEDLRRQFEEDVKKVKRLKEEKEYRPF